MEDDTTDLIRFEGEPTAQQLAQALIALAPRIARAKLRLAEAAIARRRAELELALAEARATLETIERPELKNVEQRQAFVVLQTRAAAEAALAARAEHERAEAAHDALLVQERGIRLVLMPAPLYLLSEGR